MDTELTQLSKTDRNPVEETRYQELMKGSGGGGSYDSLISSLPKATDAANTINKGIDDTFGQYLGAVKSAPTSLDTYQKSLDSGGIPQLQKTQSTLQGQIYDLEDTLRRVEPNVSATTRNSIVTEGQRQGMVEERQKPLIENLGWLGQSLGRVSSAVSEGKANALTLTGLSQQDSGRVLDAYKEKLNLAVTQGGQALQAFIHDSDNVLNVTLAKLHRGEQVSDQEASHAFELLKMQKTAELANSPDTQVVETNGHKYLVNMQTGEKIADLGSNGSGNGGGDVSKYYATPSSNASNSDWEIAPQPPHVTNILDYNKWRDAYPSQ